MRRVFYYFSFFCVTVFLSQCTATVSGSLQSAPTVSVQISPAQVSLRTFDVLSNIYGTEYLSDTDGSSVNVSSNTDSTLFTWEVEEGPAGGSLAPSPQNGSYFTYTAPAYAGIYHVSITDLRDSTQGATLTIQVTN
jgi:hypothetical protein